MKPLNPAAWLATFVACAFAGAAAPTTRPGLHLTTPAGWTQEQDQLADPKKPAGIIITAPAKERVRLRIQPIPLGDKVLTDDVIQKLVTNMAKPELGDQPVPEMEKIEGSASGYRVTFKPVQKADGEQFQVTDAVVQMPGLALAVGITHRNEPTSLNKALNIIKNATFGRAAKPAH